MDLAPIPKSSPALTRSRRQPTLAPMANSGAFTPLTARKAAQASILARAKRRAEIIRRCTIIPDPPQDPGPTPPPTAPSTEERYPRMRLAVVRAQIALIDAAIMAEAGLNRPDGQRLNWLAAAQEKLAEQERLLAGRPLPGSRKPPIERGTPTRSRPDVIFTVPADPAGQAEGEGPEGISLPAPTVHTSPPVAPAQARAPLPNETPPCNPGEDPRVRVGGNGGR